MMSKNKWILFLFLIANHYIAYTQPKFDIGEKKVLRSLAIESPIKIDGELKEHDWDIAPLANNFTNLEPEPNILSNKKTEVRVLYDNSGIYIGAKMYDAEPNKILTELSMRDQKNMNADNFSVWIDGMYNQQNAFIFCVSAAGAQYDAFYANETQDPSWDAPWYSAVKINEEGWVAEIKIPYASLRFPDRQFHIWGINFQRTVRRTRESSFWSPIDPQKAGRVQQFGILQDIENIKTPVRLQFTPYLAVYNKYKDDRNRETSNWKSSVAGGVDIRYGINDSYTLDMSLIPDFGEVISDDILLNISPFEIRYDERRPFFNENTDIFNRAGLFYSRRIGQQPVGAIDVYKQITDRDSIIENPKRAPLLNAIKVSGRNRKGLGVGVFNAVTNNAYAKIESGSIYRDILTEPLTNYNVFVIDYILRPNSYVSFVNTNVMRNSVYADANVTASEFRILDKKSNYGIYGKLALSMRFLEANLVSEKTKNGSNYSIGFEKASGLIQFNIKRDAYSPEFNPNDIGFLTNANEVKNIANISLNTFKPFSLFNKTKTWVETEYRSLYAPDRFMSWRIAAGTNLTFKNFSNFSVQSNYYPMGIDDYFEPRIPLKHFKRPSLANLYISYASDTRKALACEIGLTGMVQNEWDAKSGGLRLVPRWRINDHFNVQLTSDFLLQQNDYGFVDKNDSTQLVILGQRNRRTIENNLQFAYLFSTRTSLIARARHYWSIVDYKNYYTLQDDGSINLNADYTQNKNLNFNAFNIDFVFRWIVAPASEFNFIYKTAILSEQKNIIYDFGQNFSNTWAQNPNHTVTLKLIYWLDYEQIKRKRGSSKKNNIGSTTQDRF